MRKALQHLQVLGRTVQHCPRKRIDFHPVANNPSTQLDIGQYRRLIILPPGVSLLCIDSINC